MKRSARVTLTMGAAIGLAACGRRQADPCKAATFNEMACQDAIRNGGYYWNGTWFPMRYGYPYPYFYDAYRGYVSRGGAVDVAPAGVYSAPVGGVERGGFGASGEAHGGDAGAAE